MNQYYNPIAILRQLKGAPLSVLIALTIVQPRHVSSSWLCGCTGYSHDATTNATSYLREMGFIDCDQQRSSWRIAENAMQLPLPVSMISPDNVEDAEKPHPAPTTTALNTIGRDNRSEAAAEALSLTDAEKPHALDVLTILHQAGIGSPTAENLCKLEHMTPEYARAHITKAKEEKKPIPLLIHRMMSRDPAPAIPLTEEERRMRYVNGPLSDWIEH
jgi:hypothetical protein